MSKMTDVPSITDIQKIEGHSMARWILWGIAVEDDEVEGERGGAGVRDPRRVAVQKSNV